MRSIVALCALLVVAATLVSATNQKGLDFLAANKVKPGVVTLPSGLQYKGAHTFDPSRKGTTVILSNVLVPLPHTAIQSTNEYIDSL